MAKGHYVLECGPANCKVGGRDKERENKTLQFLDPFETRIYQIEIGVLDGEREILSCIEEIRSYKKR